MYYNDYSERDRLLVRRWRTEWEVRSGRVNPDQTHQCLLGYDPEKTSAALPPSIIRPFALAQHFYACLECGQEHICYRDARHCPTLISSHDTSILICHFSTQQVSQKADAKFCGTHNDQKIADDNARHDLREENNDRMNLEHSFKRFKPRKSMLYSNSRAQKNQDKNVKENKNQEKPVNDGLVAVYKSHSEKKHPSTTAATKMKNQEESTGEDEEEERENDADEREYLIEKEQKQLMDNEDGGALPEDDDESYESRAVTSERLAPLSNTVYWDEYYSFLDSMEPDFAVKLIDEEEPAVALVGNAIAWIPCVLTEEQCSVIVETTRDLIIRLLALQIQCAGLLGGFETWTKKQRLINSLLVYYSALLQRVVSLVLATPNDDHLSVTQICETLLLQMLADNMSVEDQSCNLIELWHGCAWLQCLHKCGAISLFYGEKHVSKKSKTSASVVVARHNRKTIKKYAASISHVLCHYYRGQALWLRQFILDEAELLNTEQTCAAHSSVSAESCCSNETVSMNSEDDDEWWEK